MTGMVEPGERPGLSIEPFGESRFCRQQSGHYFKGNPAVQRWLASLVDGAHSALAQKLDDL